MNNEEKILEILERHDQKFDTMQEILTRHDQKFDAVDATMAAMQETQAAMQETMATMQETLTRVAVTQENVVIPQLKALSEGHQLLLETLAPKNRVEALEDDVALLKTVIKTLSQEVAELKQAQ